MKNSYDIVRQFEERVAEYAGAKYGVAVDSCTNALQLCCEVMRVDTVSIPKFTYVGVAASIIHAGGTVVFDDRDWSGVYLLNPYGIVDSARRFTKGMYVTGTLYCLSFHWSKHLPIGRGGMILCDDVDIYEWLKRTRFDGRTEGIPPKEDDFILGHHFYMTPEQAARGLMLMDSIPEHNEDLPEKNYPDLSKQRVFQ